MLFYLCFLFFSFSSARISKFSMHLKTAAGAFFKRIAGIEEPCCLSAGKTFSTLLLTAPWQFLKTELAVVFRWPAELMQQDCRLQLSLLEISELVRFSVTSRPLFSPLSPSPLSISTSGEGLGALRSHLRIVRTDTARPHLVFRQKLRHP